MLHSREVARMELDVSELNLGGGHWGVGTRGGEGAGEREREGRRREAERGCGDFDVATLVWLCWRGTFAKNP
jgi:aryl-alcohol dehydrogenase-like predicted oxidoreductase